MRYLILFLFTFNASAAMKRYLVPCNDGIGVCNIGTNQVPTKLICQVSDSTDGNLFRIEITDSEGVVLRSWDKSEVLAENEKILCTLDPVKVILKEAEEKAKADAEKAKKDKEAADWQTACAGAKAGSVEALICIERGY